MKDLKGKKIGRLTILVFDHRDKNSMAYYRCVCDCGTEKIIRYAHIASGAISSCGCLLSESVIERQTKYDDATKASARQVWAQRYADGCSFEKFFELSQLPCYYCGVVRANCYNRYLASYKRGDCTKKRVDGAYWYYNGLDRIDSTKTHTEDNIVPCCPKCNTAKGNQTLDEFKRWLKRCYSKLYS